MKSLVSIMLVLLAAFTLVMVGQSVPSKTPTLSGSETQFWAFFFGSIADPAEDPRELAIREDIVVQKFGLNVAEAALLHTVASQFSSAAADVRQQADKIMSGKTSLSADEQAAMAALDTLQGQRIAVWTNVLMTQWRPEIIARFNKVIR